MAVTVGSVTIPGSTGTFSVTGLAFQPVAVVLFNQFDHLAPHSFTFGCATGSSEQWGVWAGEATEISGYTARKHEGRTDACAFHRDSVTDAEQWRVSFVSFESDGFTLSLDVRNTVASGEGANIYYMALGGAHISEAHAGVFEASSSGTVAVTDPGFMPTAMLFAHGWVDFDAGISVAPNACSVIGTGLTDGTTSFSSEVVNYQNSAILVNHIYRADAVACAYNRFGPHTFRMELDSFDATGFTVDVVDDWFQALDHGYLALKADGAVAGVGTQPDSNTTLTYATPGLIPEGVFFCWPGVDVPSTSGATTVPMRPGVGAGTISQQRMSAGIDRSSAPFGVYTSDGYQIPTEPLGFWGVGDGIAGGSNASQASADIASLDQESFDLVWTNVLDTNDRVFGWLALPGELVGSWIPHIYRRVSG